MLVSTIRWAISKRGLEERLLKAGREAAENRVRTLMSPAEKRRARDRRDADACLEATGAIR
jgi:hypothetical protein